MYKYRVMLKDRRPYAEKVSDTNYEEKVLEGSAELAEYIEDVFHIKNAAEEYMVMLCLTSEQRPVSVFEVSHGTSEYTYASPREIFKMALLGGAENIVLAHNHPSCGEKPSQKDEKLLKDIKRAAKTLDIGLWDFLIFGDNLYSAYDDGKI